ncbi:endonuclease/exonuclease/phosphatase family protein [Nonomuraea sp. NPDC046570]|uniref:endonuclease/exonuclease/phosphatase family protein n=1 Tax=Nonomuraea sp. NPDC046570 TaxID=3155255 RepID=UPI0033D304A0
MTIPRGPAVMLGLGVVLLFDALRVFLPSLITLFGRAGDTPPEQMGLYAALWFVLPFLAIPLRPHWSLYGGALALATLRLSLQAFDGGPAQLHLSSAAVTAALVFLYGCARTLPRPAVAPGVAGGLVFAVVSHLLLDGVDLVWRDGALPWIATALLCATFLLYLRLTPPAPADDLAPWAAWFLVGPALLLVGMYSGSSIALLDWNRSWVIPVVTVGPLLIGCAFLFRQATRVPASRWTPARDAVLVALGMAVTLIDPGNHLLHVLALLSIGGLLGASARPGAPAGRPGAGLLGGMLVFLVALFLYYSAYDLDLGFPNMVIPVLVALALGAIGTVSMSRTPAVLASVRDPWPWRPFAAALLTLPLVLVSIWRPTPDQRPKDGDTFTLIAYNVRMGYGLDGRLSLDRIASWAAAQKPDVVLLSELDRGWLLNGGHDGLSRIAKGLGMRAYFAPAADTLWGEALLTNLPVKQLASHRLGRHDYPTGAQAQAIVLEVGGKEVGIVNTHLQAPPGQAPEVAALARNLATGLSAEAAGVRVLGPMSAMWPAASVSSDDGSAGERPVILAGDLNTRPGDPEMRVLEAAGLSDPLTAFGDPPTSPAEAPVVRIDHVLVTKGLSAVKAEVPPVPYSDHLPVVVTLRITSVDQEG